MAFTCVLSRCWPSVWVAIACLVLLAAFVEYTVLGVMLGKPRHISPALVTSSSFIEQCHTNRFPTFSYFLLAS